jgi:hypothetical protein
MYKLAVLIPLALLFLACDEAKPSPVVTDWVVREVEIEVVKEVPVEVIVEVPIEVPEQVCQ